MFSVTDYYSVWSGKRQNCSPQLKDNFHEKRVISFNTRDDCVYFHRHI